MSFGPASTLQVMARQSLTNRSQRRWTWMSWSNIYALNLKTSNILDSQDIARYYLQYIYLSLYVRSRDLWHRFELALRKRLKTSWQRIRRDGDVLSKLPSPSVPRQDIPWNDWKGDWKQELDWGQNASKCHFWVGCTPEIFWNSSYSTRCPGHPATAERSRIAKH